jgi:hypothetical protein
LKTKTEQDFHEGTLYFKTVIMQTKYSLEFIEKISLKFVLFSLAFVAVIIGLISFFHVNQTYFIIGSIVLVYAVYNYANTKLTQIDTIGECYFYSDKIKIVQSNREKEIFYADIEALTGIKGMFSGTFLNRIDKTNKTSFKTITLEINYKDKSLEKFNLYVFPETIFTNTIPINDKIHIEEVFKLIDSEYIIIDKYYNQYF